MLKKPLALTQIFVSGIISWLIAMVAVPLDKMEMGALFNCFGPAIVLVVSPVLFLLVDWLFPRVRLYSVCMIAVLNIAFGIYIRYWSIAQIN